MANLTWRDVAAPDFRPSMEGYQQFSQLLGNAFSGLDRGLQRYDQTITDRVNSNILAQLAQVQDIDHAKTAAHNLLAGVDPRRVNAETLTALMARPGQLIQQNSNEEALNYNTYVHGRTRHQNELLDAAGPAVSNLLEAGLRGDDAAVQQLFHNDPSLRALGPEALLSLASNAQDRVKGNVDIAGGRESNLTARQNREQGATRFNWEVTDRADQQAGMAAFQQVAQSSMTAEDAIAALAPLNLTPGAYAFAIQQLEPRFPGIIGAAGGASSADVSGMPVGGAGPGGADPTRVMNYVARDHGFNVVPPSVQTMGQASQFARQVNRAGASSSAMGTYQITGDTLREFGPQALGRNWENAPFNQQNQDRIAEAIFNSSRNSAAALRGRWTSLSLAEAERVRRMPWAEARRYIAQGESGAVIPPAPNMAAAVIQGAVAQGQVNNGGAGQTRVIQQTPAAQSPVEVAAQLTRPGNAFAGVPRGWLAEKIQEVVTRSHGTLNPMQAGEILMQNLTQQHQIGVGRFIRRVINGPQDESPNLGNGMRLNDYAVNQAIEDARHGRYVDRAVRAERINTITQQLSALQAADAAAQQRLAMAQRRAAVSDEFRNSSLPRYVADAQAARQAYLMAYRSAAPELRPPNQVREPSHNGLAADILTAALGVGQ